jgi:hypothetical protein
MDEFLQLDAFAVAIDPDLVPAGINAVIGSIAFGRRRRFLRRRVLLSLGVGGIRRDRTACLAADVEPGLIERGLAHGLPRF